MEGRRVVRGPVDMLFPHMEWGSVASNWLLYESNRSSVPRPWMSGPLVLVNTKFHFDKDDKEAMAKNPQAQAALVHAVPNLYMTEVTLKDCSLGSGWAFMGALSPNVGPSFVRVRTFSFSEGNLTRILATHEISNDLLFFTLLREVDVRTNTVWTGTIDRMSRICTINSVSIDTKNCTHCEKAVTCCSCQHTELTQRFVSEFHQRRRLEEVSHNLGHFGNKYLASWCQGMWTAQVKYPATFKPFNLEANYVFEGKVFDTSLTSVVQNEVLSIQPPRVSAKFLALMQESETEIDGAFLRLSPRSDFEQESPRSRRFKVEELPPKDKKIHQCERCEMNFRRRYDLTRHCRLVHEKRRDFSCSQCSKKFSQLAHVKDHVKLVHERKREYACNICDSRFGLKYTRDRHVRGVHGDVRLFVCDICEKKCKSESSLKLHMSSHATSPRTGSSVSES